MFFLVENKENLLVISGALAILSSLPFAMMGRIFSLFDYSYLKIIPILLSKSYIVFLIVFSIGVVLLLLGIAFKFFNIGEFFVEKFGSGKGKSKKK